MAKVRGAHGRDPFSQHIKSRGSAGQIEQDNMQYQQQLAAALLAETCMEEATKRKNLTTIQAYICLGSYPPKPPPGPAPTLKAKAIPASLKRPQLALVGYMAFRRDTYVGVYMRFSANQLVIQLCIYQQLKLEFGLEHNWSHFIYPIVLQIFLSEVSFLIY